MIRNHKTNRPEFQRRAFSRIHVSCFTRSSIVTVMMIVLGLTRFRRMNRPISRRMRRRRRDKIIRKIRRLMIKLRMARVKKKSIQQRMLATRMKLIKIIIMTPKIMKSQMTKSKNSNRMPRIKLKIKKTKIKVARRRWPPLVKMISSVMARRKMRMR